VIVLNGLNAAQPAPVTSASGTVTLVEGSTFCLSDGNGDVTPGTGHGLFFQDTRVISRWELRLDGQPPHPLSVLTPEVFAARFVLRNPPRGGQSDAAVLVVRDRLVGDGMRETITVRNLGLHAVEFALVLDVDADFADLFAVKAGRADKRRAEVTATGAELFLRDGDGGSRGLCVDASGDPAVLPGALSWRVAIPAKGSWASEILAQPTLGAQRVPPLFHRGERLETSQPARKIRAWRSETAVIEAGDPVLTQALRRSVDDLGVLRIADPSQRGMAFVAAGAPWYMTLFGRDSLLTAWMALPLDVGLALGTLTTLARTQGRRIDPATEEEPGRILHEFRRGPEHSRVLGGSHYYGTVDATPLFVMLLAECWRWGGEEAAVRALLPAADAALSWIDGYGDRDGDGFVEYERATDRGLINQGWKDSSDGINDAAGRIAATPLALCEVQGYVYAAWRARAELAEGFGDPATALRCAARAQALRTRFAESFWLPERGWYAVALDGRKRHVDALTSNAAHCLWSGIARDEHAAVLVERLAAADMDTGYGLRTLAASMAAYNPMSYHNGSVWPHDTAIAVAGLLRYSHIDGAAELASRLATGLFDAAAAFGGRLPELFCGFARDDFSPPVPYPSACSPQAWASAAPLLVVRAFLGLAPHVPHRTLTVRPHVPARWGEVTLSRLRLGPVTVRVSAEGDRASVTGLPDGWTAQ